MCYNGEKNGENSEVLFYLQTNKFLCLYFMDVGRERLMDQRFRAGRISRVCTSVLLVPWDPLVCHWRVPGGCWACSGFRKLYLWYWVGSMPAFCFRGGAVAKPGQVQDSPGQVQWARLLLKWAERRKRQMIVSQQFCLSFTEDEAWILKISFVEHSNSRKKHYRSSFTLGSSSGGWSYNSG